MWRIGEFGATSFSVVVVAFLCRLLLWLVLICANFVLNAAVCAKHEWAKRHCIEEKWFEVRADGLQLFFLNDFYRFGMSLHGIAIRALRILRVEPQGLIFNYYFHFSVLKWNYFFKWGIRMR